MMFRMAGHACFLLGDHPKVMVADSRFRASGKVLFIMTGLALDRARALERLVAMDTARHARVMLARILPGAQNASGNRIDSQPTHARRTTLPLRQPEQPLEAEAHSSWAIQTPEIQCPDDMQGHQRDKHERHRAMNHLPYASTPLHDNLECCSDVLLLLFFTLS